jgi:antitoxin MazE
MHASLVRIGNSQGIRLPKAVIEQARLGKNLDLEVVDGAVIIRSEHAIRAGWADAAKACHEQGDDRFDEWEATAADFAGDDR